MDPHMDSYLHMTNLADLARDSSVAAEIQKTPYG
jgi:hypothetical protein